jgi:choline-sulfatase
MLRFIAMVFATGFLTAPLSVAESAARPNILFIVTDQQFAEAMSNRMGKEFLHTPAMDGLAEKGLLFTRAYSSNPLCVPFRASAFTGRHSHEIGVSNNLDTKVRIPTEKFPSMGTWFQNGGYKTAYSGKWHLPFNIRDPKSHGFEIVTGKGPRNDHDGAVTRGAIRFLKRPHDKPFLLVACYLNPHDICEWARQLAGRKQFFQCGNIGEPPAAAQLPPAPTNLAPQRNEPDGLALMRRAYQVETGIFPVSKFTEVDWQKFHWGYHRMIEKVDAEIGKLLAALRDAGLEDNTMIVFTSDHGEAGGAHGWNQKTVFYDESARIPLIITGKGVARAATTAKLVNTGIDLLPTLMDLAGMEVPKQLPGRSLAPLLNGGGEIVWRDHIVAQNDLDQSSPIDGMKPRLQGRMVRSERYKYCIYSHGNQRESLVDMQKDPGETVNLAADPAHRAALLEHRELLARFGREHKDPLVATLLADGVKPIPFPATAE